MRRRRRSATAILVTVLTIAIAGWPLKSATAQGSSDPEPTADAMILDALLLRPLGLAKTAVGAGVFVASLPFTVFSGSVSDAARKLVIEPAKDTFGRPLGELRKRP